MTKAVAARLSAAVLAERLRPVVADVPAAEPVAPAPSPANFTAVDKTLPVDAVTPDEAGTRARTDSPASTTTTAPPVTTTAPPPAPTTTTTAAPPPTTTTAPPPTTTTAPPVTTTTAPPVEGGERDVEFWRPLVETYFPADLVDDALVVIDCESNGDPLAHNPVSGAAGLFQFIPSTWDWASVSAGWAGASPYDPEANVATAAWLVADSIAGGHSGGAWGHWSCKP